MLRLSYILHEHGWATASISDGETIIEMDVSYLSDALGDFARAARGIVRGLSEAMFDFVQEPGTHRIVLSRESDRVRASVYRFSGASARSSRGEPVLVAEDSVRVFTTECINCLRRVLDEQGELGYRKRWKNAEFPLREYGDLLDLRARTSGLATSGIG